MSFFLDLLGFVGILIALSKLRLSSCTVAEVTTLRTCSHPAPQNEMKKKTMINKAAQFLQ